MTSEYSITVNWHEEFEIDCDKWHNEGQRVAREILEDKDHEKHIELLNDLGYYEEPTYPSDVAYENFEPMMNYAYPLRVAPSNEQIYAIINETCLTVMYNDHNENSYLVLTGGGMDLSQDIALAYLLAGERIPTALAYNVSTQYGLSKSSENWFKIMNACKESLDNTIGWYTDKVNRIKESTKKATKVKER